jgi:hypothetical protein
MTRYTKLALVASAMLVTLSTAAAQGQASADDLVRRAVAAYESSVHGIIAMRRHFTTSINAGIVKHSEESESALLLRDGAFVTAKYYRITQDGKPFGPRQIEDRDKETNQKWSAGQVFFKEPYDPRFTADYKFSFATCADCHAGTEAIAFSSATRDAQHGAGTMVMDAATGHVETLTYVPYALPPHATSGRVTETSGHALPDLWYVTHIEETYDGRAFVLKGTGTFNGTFDEFQRYRTVEEGEVAVEKGTVGALVSR